MTHIISAETLTKKKVSRGTRIGRLLLPWLVPFILIVIWQAASSVGWLESRILPAPTAVISAF